MINKPFTCWKPPAAPDFNDATWQTNIHPVKNHTSEKLQSYPVNTSNFCSPQNVVDNTFLYEANSAEKFKRSECTSVTGREETSIDTIANKSSDECYKVIPYNQNIKIYQNEFSSPSFSNFESLNISASDFKDTSYFPSDKYIQNLLQCSNLTNLEILPFWRFPPPPITLSPESLKNLANSVTGIYNGSLDGENLDDFIPLDPNKYRTELCRSFQVHGVCSYGTRSDL